MQPTTEPRTISRNHPPGGAVATEPRGNAKLRKVGFGASLALVPAAIGGVVGLLAGSRRAGVIAGGASALLLGVARWQLERSFNDEPDYTVEQRIGGLELRRYQPRVEAQTTISVADYFHAIDRGFDRLAAFIFGANDHREDLGMTTPVTAREVGGDVRIAFMMPIHRTASSLPRPTDGRIEVIDVAGRRIAVLTFTGARSDELIRARMDELRERCAAAGLLTMGQPTYAGFDPPWTLPWIRRNEVWIEIA